MYDGRTIYFDKKGYAIVWVDGKNRKVHVLEWEKHNGPKPAGYIVHHKDHNKANWTIDNLQLVTQSDHLRIHAGWVMENGVWVKKPCKDCGQILPLDLFYQRKGLTPSNRCVPCSASYFKRRNTQKYRAQRKIYMHDYYLNNKEKFV
jgi:hypothetical protein